jgi:carbon-monoxide dehydrogenase large subunit
MSNDIVVSGQPHFAPLAHGHASIEGIDASAARAMPGRRFTAGDLDADGIGRRRIARVATAVPMTAVASRARGRVRHVGDPVAFVVADTAQQARDATERVDVRSLPAVVDAEGFSAEEAPLLWDEAPGTHVSV